MGEQETTPYERLLSRKDTFLSTAETLSLKRDLDLIDLIRQREPWNLPAELQPPPLEDSSAPSTR